MELKFRAWSKNDLKKDIFMKFETVKNPGIVRFEWNDDINKHPFTYDLGIVLADDDWLVEQYIGLKDYYVGDILYDDFDDIIYEIVYEDCKFVGVETGEHKDKALIDLWECSNYLTKIGNIHENKELTE